VNADTKALAEAFPALPETADELCIKLGEALTVKNRP